MGRKLHRRIITLVMAVIMFLSSVTVPELQAFANNSENSSSVERLAVWHEGKEVTSVSVNQYGHETLQAEKLSENAEYQWEILLKDTEDTWIKIYDKTGTECLLSYALFGSMLDQTGKAYVRCTASDSGVNYVSDAIAVTLSYVVPDGLLFSKHNDVSGQIAGMQLRDVQMVGANAGEYVTITIEYKYDENYGGGKAFDPYIAHLQRGTDFTAEVPSPTIVGFEPKMNGIAADSVTLDVTGINENIVYTVIYSAAKVPYKARYFLQNVNDDLYTENLALVSDAMGFTGDYPDDALVRKEIEGFSALYYQPERIAADGSTEFYCYYDRNYYLINFELDGGFGVEPIYARYGTAFVVNNPEKPGYLFGGWQWKQEDATYVDANLPATVPPGNRTYKAKWRTTIADYTVVFWKENADDDQYSYWGSGKLEANSGSFVDGEAYDSNRTYKSPDHLDEIEKELNYFTYNGALSDKQVLVEGDDSSIVNVYYTRNRYTLKFNATGKCGLEEHTHTEECYRLICGKEEHIHADNCLLCNIQEHKHAAECCSIESHEHSDECVNCIHTHDLSCWGLEKNDKVEVGDVPDYVLKNANYSPENGKIYSGKQNWYSNTRYYLYFDNNWYCHHTTRWGSTSADPTKEITPCTHTHGEECIACGKEVHSHTEGFCDYSNCTLDEHVHGVNCYECGEVSHTHNELCKSDPVCDKIEHTHTNNCTNSNRTNTVYQITGKYQQDIHKLFPLINDSGDYTGYWWEVPNGSIFFEEGKYVVSIDTMPGENLTFTGEYKGKNAKIYYYLEVLDGDAFEKEHNNRYYDLHKTVYTVKSGYLTEKEEFHDIKGFEKGEYSPEGIFNSNPGVQGENFLYYTRNNYTLNFYNYNGFYGNEKELQYKELLKEYELSSPSYPDNLEPNAYEFAGWYSTAGCYDGTEVKWDTMSMPANNLTIYAKWAPTIHQVRYYTSYDKVGTSEIYAGPYDVAHGNVLTQSQIPEDPKREEDSYAFVGWFYMEDGVKKAFYPYEMAVTKDLDLFAEWSSSEITEYTIYYKDENGNTIADPTTGYIFAGQTKTFTAKTGDALYEEYQTRYYPHTNSHSIVMSAEEGAENTFTFVYKYLETVPYEVQYLDAQTKLPVIDSEGNPVPKKIVPNNSAAVITEKFKPIAGMRPDAYYKRLVLSADPSQNVIKFYYAEDSEHAYYAIRHFIENEDGTGYTEYMYSEAIGDIGVPIIQEPLTITGFAYNVEVTTEGNKGFGGVKVDSNGVTGTITADGLEMHLYYTRKECNYEIRYIKYGTEDEKVADSVKGKEKYGKAVEAKAIEVDGYTVIGDPVRELIMRSDTEVNVLTFYYTEKQYTIRYIPVCTEAAEDYGRVTMSMQVGTSAIEITGSTPIAEEGFKFEGWYTDAECTKDVEASDATVDESTKHIQPKTWKDATYYALFSPIVTDLKITKTGVAPESKDSFLFRIKGAADAKGPAKNIDVTVSIQGNGTATIEKLPVGKYTVEELTEWSWRYEINGDSVQNVTAVVDETAIVTFKNTQNDKAWLGGEGYKKNEFTAMQ